MMLGRDPIKTNNPFGALNSRSRSGSAAAGKPITPPSSLTSGADGKKKRKKKKKSKASKANFDLNSVNSSSVEEPVTDTESVEEEPLPLAKRLEVAASHTDLHAALVGLVGWSRLYLNTDTIMAIFHCDALQLLFVNVLTCRTIKSEATFDHLTELLANCLYVEHSGKDSTSNKQAAAAVAGTLRAVIGKESTWAEADEQAVAMNIVAPYLSKVVLQYRMSLNGNIDSSFSKELFDIETQLAAFTTKDSAVKGETIRESFQRRDIRSDTLALHDLRLKKAILLQQEERSGDVAQPEFLGKGQLVFRLQSPEDEVQVDEQQVQDVKSQLAQLSHDKEEQLAPLRDKRKLQAEQLECLKQQRDELEAKLRAINGSIQGVETNCQELDAQVTVIHEAFGAKTSRFNEEHKHILEAYERKHRRELIQSEFDKLVTSIAAVRKEHSGVRSVLDIQKAAVQQHLESALKYFDSELLCVKFMKNRVEAARIELLKLTQEANDQDALNLHAEAEELHDKANAIRAHLGEDTKCVAALSKRDLEIVASMERIFTDTRLQEPLDLLDEHLKKEARRHIEYVRMVHAESDDEESEVATRSKAEEEDAKHGQGA